MKNPELFFAARDDDGALVGFYFFQPRDDALFYRLGLRPDLPAAGWASSSRWRAWSSPAAATVGAA